MRTGWVRGLLPALGAVVLGTIYWTTGEWESVQRTRGPITQEAYVWQRAWTPAVRSAVKQSADSFASLVALAAEVDLSGSRRRIARIALDASAVHSTGIPLGLALRIGPYPGPFLAGDEAGSLVVRLAGNLLEDAEAKGVAASELQLDFDCAESRLEGYRVWVEAIRTRIRPIPLVITALPSWLERRAFRALAEAAGGFVLQVHSLERPQTIESQVSLCDRGAAARAVEKAARLGLPFRVALPAYGYLLAFDGAGKFAGLSAEGPAPAWPPGTRLLALRADPVELAGLVEEWTRSRPASLSGIIWYRLPTEDDRLGWRWSTLAAVMEGRAPRTELTAQARRPEPGLVEVDLLNTGEADLPVRAAVSVRWQRGLCLASDALAGFERMLSGPGEIRLRAAPSCDPDRLAPGERRMVGWLRMDRDLEVEVDVAPGGG